MTAPTATLHYAEATLREGLLINGWRPPASLYVQLADGWAAAGDLARAYEYARMALTVKEQEGALKLNHPLAVLRLRRDSEALQGGIAGVSRQAHAPEGDDAITSPLSSKILTRKEREILQLLARSYSNKEIATALDVSDETVKWHLKNMFNKLEAGSRKHAVTRARTLGVISFSS
jgi:ATP/maltotriose-dependent transcriptional regulator MalT